MPRRLISSLALLAFAALALAGCGRSPSDPLNTEEKVIRAVLARLASDGKPVCVARATFHSPLSVYQIAMQGKLQRLYALGWYPPHPFRPPVMPTLDALQRSNAKEKNADIPEPLARKDALPRRRQAALDAAARALGPPDVPTRMVHLRDEWMPRHVYPRWWPAADARHGCTNLFVLSGVKANRHVAFVGLRVDHWGTIYALAPLRDEWRVIAQWATWLY